ncbi:MAG: sulfite exporter TauE/SafE family protein [Flavobacteriales bacterium]|nr:sulfite exporter TauE/SafE family protein [Flavobacteriales bacterium]
MEIIIIPLVAFLVSILTFFSGFGLGTILTPAFMLFFPVELSIGLTGIVHFLNNLFKLFLVGKNANKEILIRFGIPAIVAAFIGAWVLVQIPTSQILYSYTAFEKIVEVSVLKFTMALLLAFFAVLDLIPFLNSIQFGKKQLPIGGILSGFFGGLSGNQGALRSAFLIKIGLSKEVFVATTVVISCFVDFTRLSVYASHLKLSDLNANATLIVVATLAAFLGAFLGNKLLKKVTLKFVQTTVAILLIIMSLGLGLGAI